MNDDSDFKVYLRGRHHEVEKALQRFLPRASAKPATLHRAMHHSLFAGGKRLRPVLCLAAAEACGGDREAALPQAVAVECLHTYSLIHDDLPCMDDDDFRRGHPTCHKVFGEGIAVLAGDALLTHAFEVIAVEAHPTRRYDRAVMVAELAKAGGSRQLIAGQVLDLEGEGQALTLAALKGIHERKTGALLTASLSLGGMSANATPARLEALREFGRALGLAFQVIDDILDVTQSSEKLGKSAGKDEAVDKATYPALLGLEKSRAEAARLTARAHRALEPFGRKGERLAQLADYLLDRDY